MFGWLQNICHHNTSCKEENEKVIKGHSEYHDDKTSLKHKKHNDD